MRKGEYQRLYQLESTYWWHIGRRAIIEVVLRRHLTPPQKNLKILDVGCGTGLNAIFLSRFGQVTGVDKAEEAVYFCRQRGIKDVHLGEATNLQFKNETFDLVVALDLFEHLGNDRPAIQEFYRVLKKGGYLLTMVPAYKWLWSEHDEALHHQRRYTAVELREKHAAAGFKILKWSYCVTFTLLLIISFRLITKIFGRRRNPKTSYVILPSPLNRFLIYSLLIESKLLNYFSLPFGVSIVLLARK